MKTQKTILARLNEMKAKQKNLEAKYGYNAGHDFKDIIKELEWVLGKSAEVTIG